jgi:hypothetical protein
LAIEPRVPGKRRVQVHCPRLSGKPRGNRYWPQTFLLTVAVASNRPMEALEIWKEGS